jgi:hypothetical protein
MLINSSELRVTGFKVKEVIPPSLETVAYGGLWTRGVGSLEGWTLKGLFCQWMTTLNSGHDLGE